MYPTYGRHKVSQKFNRREVIKKVRKEKQSFLHVPCPSWPHTHCYKVSSKYSIWLPNHDMHKDSVKKISSKRSYSETKKGGQSFLYVIYRLNLIHIALKFHRDIPYGYLWYAQGQSKISSKGSNLEIEKGKTIFFCTRHTMLTSYSLL